MIISWIGFIALPVDTRQVIPVGGLWSLNVGKYVCTVTHEIGQQ